MILVVGENSAWQKTYLADTVRRGAVNRMRRSYASAAGKGANVCRVLGFLGVESKLIAYAGGATGSRFRDACEADGIEAVFVRIEAETRFCTTIIENDRTTTEIIEPPPAVTETESSMFHSVVESSLAEASLLVVSGTAVGAEPADRYREFIEAAHGLSIPVLLDSYRVHGKAALAASPEVVKINEVELAELTGLPADSLDNRARASAFLRKRYRVRWVIVTRGGRGAEGFCAGRALRATAPRVEIVNSIGSGDAFTAGVAATVKAAGVVDAADIAEAVRIGAALGTANCLDIKPGRIDRDLYERILSEVRVVEA